MIKCHFSDVAAGNIISSNRLTSLKSRLSASLDRYVLQSPGILEHPEALEPSSRSVGPRSVARLDSGRMREEGGSFGFWF